MALELTDTSEKIPEGARKLFSRLSGEVLWLREKWHNYRYLFAQSPERIEVLNACGGTFFYIVDHLFIDDFILCLSRLTDRAEGRNSNLSLEQLVLRLDPLEHADLIDRLAPILKSLGDKVVTLRKHRDKRVAHRDLSVALSAQDILPSVSREIIEKALLEGERFLRVFDFHFSGVEFHHEMLGMHDGADRLYAKMIKAQAYEALERDGTIPRGIWRKFEQGI
jgi:HEPN superfamily AbiU2-like protein